MDVQQLAVLAHVVVGALPGADVPQEGGGHVGPGPRQLGAILGPGLRLTHPSLVQFSILKTQRMCLQGKGGGTGSWRWNILRFKIK